MEVEYDCPSQCTRNMGNEIHIFSSTMHMQHNGLQMWTTHWREGKLIGEINRIDFWDYGFHQVGIMRIFSLVLQNTPVNITFVPGDRVNIHCVFKQSSGYTAFGDFSHNEMCIHYVAYYPAIPDARCAYWFSTSSQTNVTMCGPDVLLENGVNLVMISDVHHT